MEINYLLFDRSENEIHAICAWVGLIMSMCDCCRISRERVIHMITGLRKEQYQDYSLVKTEQYDKDMEELTLFRMRRKKRVLS